MLTRSAGRQVHRCTWDMTTDQPPLFESFRNSPQHLRRRSRSARDTAHAQQYPFRFRAKSGNNRIRV